MKKLILLSSAVFLFGHNIKYAVHQNHAFLMAPYKKNITLEYDLLNDTVDILNLKKSEHIDTKSFGNIGDLKGFKISGIYGLNQKSNIAGFFDYKNIDYTGGSLKNYKTNLFYRLNILENELSNNAISCDFGITLDKANDITYSNINLLNYIGHKINPDYSIVYSNKTYYVVNKKKKETATLTQKPYIKSKDMRDNSFYVKLLAEKIWGISALTGFIKFGHTRIKTKITANSELLKKAKEQNYNLNKDLGRSENFLNVGFNYAFSINKYLVEFEYYYTKIFRAKNLSYINYNHVVNLELSRAINKNVYLFLGGKIMYRQFNGEIPYLYNKYTQTTFDHKYGYARMGIGYNF